MDFETRAARLREPAVALLSGYGLPQPELVHAARTLRSAIHGFVNLEQQSGFGLDTDFDASFGWMLDTLERGLAPPPRAHGRTDRSRGLRSPPR